MLGFSAAAALAGRARSLEPLTPTPRQTAGPFYPVDKPLDRDADLTQVRGRAGRAAGQVVHVMGRVLDSGGRPLAGVTIEVWQANAHGRYAHPGDDNPAPLDPNFEGYATLTTDAEGRYRFKTIKPGAYPAGRTRRPPHIHFDVRGPTDRLVTQMYFAGEPLNDTDGVLGNLGERRDRLIVALEPPTPGVAADSRIARWDIVLTGG
jgi:protocatechuate 3,4-dioxygenase beta subunit